MKKFRILALLLVMSFAVSACSLIEVNEEKDRAQVVATVNGVKILKGDLIDMLDEQLYYYLQYQQYGLVGELTQIELDGMIETSIDALVEQEYVMQKAKELGLELTEEEKDTALTSLNAEIADLKESFREEVQAEIATGISTEPEDALIELKYQDYLKTYNINIDTIVNTELSAVLIQKAKDDATKDVQATEEEAREWYNAKLETDKERVTETDTSYETTTKNSPVLFAPSGYLYVKQILISPETDITEELMAMEDEQTTWADEMAALIVEDKEKNSAEIDALSDKINASKAEVTKKSDAWLASIKPKADDVLAKAKAGEDFDKLVEEYNEDPGMQSEPYKSEGYLVGPNTTSYEQAFKDAAVALKREGDVSPLVATSYGYHILKVAKVVKPGDVPFEDVKDIAYETVRREKANEMMTDIMTAWKDAAKIKTYPNRYKDIGKDYL